MKKSDILVAIIMGSKSDWPTMKNTALMLDKLKIKYEVKVVSAHRTPDLLYDFASSADSRGVEIIIAGAGGSAHLPGMVASKTHLPVIGVPIKSKSLDGLDSLLSIVQMPKGIPVATVAIGKSGAINSALLEPKDFIKLGSSSSNKTIVFLFIKLLIDGGRKIA